MLPLTARTAKPLLRVAGRPFLSYTFETLETVGITGIALLVGWQKDEVVSAYNHMERKGGFTFLEQEERLGTAHAIGHARQWAKGPFLCMNGDVLPSGRTMEELIQAIEKEPDKAFMTCARVKDPSGYGLVEVDKAGSVTGLIEKPERPKGDLVNAGIYAFPQDIFEAIERTPLSRRGEYEITTTFEMLIDEGRLKAIVMEEPWIEVTYAWELLKANSYLMEGLEGEVKGDVDEGAHLEGPVVVKEGARVRSGAYIIGPVFIDEGADVGPNCFIRPSTYIGKGCRVGNAVEVKNTILMDGSNIPHHNYVGDSVIMEDVNLGAGTKIANLRLDEGPVQSSSKGRPISSGMRKLGAIIGPGVKTGINCSIDSGSVISEDAFVGPGARVKGFVAPRAKIH
jgi:bifunctional UDP-N-acetylglucosamine pyrophosphorylase/glucosamine-1-phosphate N-acetyltransferase